MKWNFRPVKEVEYGIPPIRVFHIPIDPLFPDVRLFGEEAKSVGKIGGGQRSERVRPMGKETADRRSLEAGHAFMYRGQVYHVVDLRPYQRRDGRWTTVAVLGACCTTCGAWFEFSTPARTGRARRFWLNRRCTAHKAPGRRAVVSSNMGVFG
ncbi:hypothetical protein [Paracoccus yeei]|jgi:hypothetical protein|uniref:hypothetical protein n=1 Tax=Paracoccus yeei TaxID=147645 RepID=UPI003BF92487